MEASERESVQGSSAIQSRSKGWTDRQVGSIGGGAWRPSLSVRGRGTGAGGGKDAWAEKRARRNGKPRVSKNTTLMSAITNDSIYTRLIGLIPTASPALARKTLVFNLNPCSSTTLQASQHVAFASSFTLALTGARTRPEHALDSQLVPLRKGSRGRTVPQAGRAAGQARRTRHRQRGRLVRGRSGPDDGR